MTIKANYVDIENRQIFAAEVKIEGRKIVAVTAIDEVVDDYRKMGMEDMNKEKLMERSERYAASFISNNSFLIFKSK